MSIWVLPHLFSSFFFVLRFFEGISLQHISDGVGLAEYCRVAPQICQGLLQALVALFIDDLACEGLAALPDALQVSELWRERLLLLDVFL